MTIIMFTVSLLLQRTYSSSYPATTQDTQPAANTDNKINRLVTVFAIPACRQASLHRGPPAGGLKYQDSARMLRRVTLTNYTAGPLPTSRRKKTTTETDNEFCCN